MAPSFGQARQLIFARLSQSSWYRLAFAKMQIARSADFDIYTTARGFRKSDLGLC